MVLNGAAIQRHRSWEVTSNSHPGRSGHWVSGPGWNQLIRDLCSRLEPVCLQHREAGKEFILVAAQVESKYGGEVLCGWWNG